MRYIWWIYWTKTWIKRKLLELPQVVSEITGINIEDIILDPSAKNTLNDCS